MPWPNPPSQSTSAVYDARNSRVQLIDGLTNQTTSYDPDHNYAPAAIKTNLDLTAGATGRGL